MADKNEKLTELKKKCNTCKKCNDFITNGEIVFDSGNINADIMLIGEAPGENEVKLHLPFVGQAGQLLDKYLKDAGIERETDLYIANILKCRPFKIGKTGRIGNRTPDNQEIQNCIGFIKKQIEIINPKLLVLAGSTALKAITSRKNCKIKKEMGKFFDIDVNGKAFKAIAILHPSYLMQYATDYDKEKTGEYLKLIKNFIWN